MTEECPYLKRLRADDEVLYWCEFDHPCIVEYNGEQCEEYNDFLKEIENETIG